MRTIYKYPLNVTDDQVISLPAGARILSAANVGGWLVLYALVTTDNSVKLEPHVIRIYGTGNPYYEVSNEQRFIGTVITHGGALVWHVFEVMP